MENKTAYSELHCISNFSFLRGASSSEQLVCQADELGYNAIAITDECSLAGIVRAHRAIRLNELSIKLIVGSEFFIDDMGFILIAPTLKAYSQLSSLISAARRRSEKGSYQLFWSDLENNTDELLCLWRLNLTSKAQLQALVTKDDVSPKLAAVTGIKQVAWLKKYFKNRAWLTTGQLLEEGYDLTACIEFSNTHELPLVASHDIHMHRRNAKALQDVVTAIRLCSTLDDSQPVLFQNGERYLKPIEELEKLYPRELLQQTEIINQRCVFDLKEVSSYYQYPSDLVPGQYTPINYLKWLCRQGVKKRFPKGETEEVKATIEKELKVIEELKYEHFFITIFDIVKFAKEKGIYCQGRGSAANSIVCYCLGITEANPLEVSLLFERFISKGRPEPPDIDVDFESKRREEVIQYIYKRYGRKRAALAATVVTYRAKSALKDVAKVMGLDLNQLENRIANYGWRYRGDNWLEEVIPEGMFASKKLLKQFKTLVQLIHGFPRHLSQHVGGFVISTTPLCELVPIENASMEDRTVIQWDKDDLQELGLIKVDVLGLGMMTAVRKTFEFINAQRKIPLSIQDINRDDPLVFDMICDSDTVGVFQIESRAQMNMLPRLKPRCYYDLVIQVSIVRPGPIHGDMVHPYLRRRNGEEAIDYPLPELKKVLGRTLGIPIFQEQVIAMAMYAADFTETEANALRKSMASWKKEGHMSHLRGKLCERLAAKGVEQSYIARIDRQIEGFGEYGFPESHAASFALVAYVSCWLKFYYPAEFCAGLLNSQPMGFYTASQLVQDVKRHGVEVLPVDINKSDWHHKVEYSNTVQAANDGKNDHIKNTQTMENLNAKANLSENKMLPKKPVINRIRLGFSLIRGLREDSMLESLADRPKEGYQNMLQLKHFAANELELLASAGALASIKLNHQINEPTKSYANKSATPFEHGCADDTKKALAADRHQAQWQVLGLNKMDGWASEFELNSEKGLPSPSLEDNIEADYATTHLSLQTHPLELIKKQYNLSDVVASNHLHQCKKDQWIVVMGFVVSRQRPKTSKGVTFLTLEDESGNINVVVWLKTAQENLQTMVRASLLLVQGKVDIDNSGKVVHVVAHQLRDMSHLDIRKSKYSRDFH